MKIKQKNFGWCATCDCVSYHFECCGNTTCNGAGGGCKNKCEDIYDEVREMIQSGQHPSIEKLKEKNKKRNKFNAEELLLAKIFNG